MWCPIWTVVEDSRETDLSKEKVRHHLIHQSLGRRTNEAAKHLHLYVECPWTWQSHTPPIKSDCTGNVIFQKGEPSHFLLQYSKSKRSGPNNWLFFKFILFYFFIQLQLSAFSPHPSTPPQPVPPPSPTFTLPLDFVLVSFIVAPIDPSSHYPLPSPLWLLLPIPFIE